MIRGVLSSRVAAVRVVVLAFVASMIVIVGAVGTKTAEAAFAGIERQDSLYEQPGRRL